MLTALEHMGAPESPSREGHSVAREHDRYIYTRDGSEERQQEQEEA